MLATGLNAKQIVGAQDTVPILVFITSMQHILISPRGPGCFLARPACPFTSTQEQAQGAPGAVTWPLVYLLGQAFCTTSWTPGELPWGLGKRLICTQLLNQLWFLETYYLPQVLRGPALHGR